MISHPYIVYSELFSFQWLLSHTVVYAQIMCDRQNDMDCKYELFLVLHSLGTIDF